LVCLDWRAAGRYGQVALGYVRRFSQEHGYRFDKQALLWDKPRLRTPEQFERCTHLVAIAHHHLVTCSGSLLMALIHSIPITEQCATPI
jgi:hypothetical protein